MKRVMCVGMTFFRVNVDYMKVFIMINSVGLVMNAGIYI